MDNEAIVESIAVLGITALFAGFVTYFFGWGIGLIAAAGIFIGGCAWEIIRDKVNGRPR